ncbi:hypothetical protein TNCV_1892521 [Trichonephila clavipes]|nr:hypothetical protein TNCV_1892521 [Trichonephila clavipes]
MKLLICRSNRSTLEFDVSDSLTARMGCLSFRVACWAASNFLANTRAPFKSLRSAIRELSGFPDHAPVDEVLQRQDFSYFSRTVRKRQVRKPLDVRRQFLSVSDTFCCRDFSWSLAVILHTRFSPKLITQSINESVEIQPLCFRQSLQNVSSVGSKRSS